MKKALVLILFFSLIFYLVSCYYDSEEYLYPQLEGNCDTTNYAFASDIKPILFDNCYSCHSNANSGFGGNIKLENYQDVEIQVDNGKLLGSVSHQAGYSPMPKGGGKLSDCKIVLIQKWIANGALNN